MTHIDPRSRPECDQDEACAQEGPHCDTCGAPLTSGLQAVMCPRGRACEFWDLEHDATLVLLRGNDPDEDDGLAAARGVVNGALLSLLIIAVVAGVIVWWGYS